METSGSLAGALLNAEQSNDMLRDHDELVRLASVLVKQSHELGVDLVVPASRAADAIVTAAQLCSNGALRIAEEAAEQRILLVDAAIVTGAVVRECAAQLRQAGAAWVGAVVVARMMRDEDELDSDPSIDIVRELVAG